jgi:hypothetical protein
MPGMAEAGRVVAAATVCTGKDSYFDAVWAQSTTSSRTIYMSNEE